MKALTFKKTAIAAALLATAGSVSAATSVSMGTVTATTDDTINVITKTKAVAAYEEAIDKNVAVLPISSEHNFIQIKTDGAIFENDLITLEFTNGGLTAASTLEVAQVNPETGTGAGNVSIVDVPVSVVSREFNSSGTVKTITLRVGSGGVTAGAVIYIGDAIADVADGDWTTTGGTTADALGAFTTGLSVELDKGATSGDQMTVTASIDYVAANLTDATFGSSTFATTVVGMGTTFSSAGTSFIDHAADDLELVGGAKAVTASGLSWAAVTTVDETKLGLDVDFDGETTNTSVSVTSPANVNDVEFDVKVVLPADCADYLDKDDTSGEIAASAVTLGGANMTKSTTETCTWSADALTDENGEAITVTFSGEDVLVSSSASVSYDAEYESVAAPALDVNKTLYTLSGDVQTHSDSFATMPYVYAFPGSGAFSYVKVDNSGASSTAKPIALVIDGTIVETVEGAEPVAFQNFYLKSVDAGEISEFTGSEILDALITPRGDAALGYEDEAVEGLSASKGYHMSVTLRPVSTGSTLAGVNFDGVNTSGIGRTPIKFITDSTTLSSIKSGVDANQTDITTVDTVVDGLDLAECQAKAYEDFVTLFDADVTADNTQALSTQAADRTQLTTDLAACN